MDLEAAKPPFDPSKPFSAATSKPAFDPSKPFTPASQSWSEAATSALTNIPSSAKQFGSDVAQPFLHPIETAKGIKNVALGVAEKTRDYPAITAAISATFPSAGAMLSAVPAGKEHEPYAEAIGKFFVDRYGSAENFKRTLATDPIGIAADLSTILSGGETALGRAPGIIGKVGRIAGETGRAIDPVSQAAKLAGKTGKGLGTFASSALGVTTGAGGEPLRAAARAGFEGGQTATALRESMRGVEPMENVVNEARGAVSQLRKERGDAYRAQMANIKANTTVLDFRKIDTAVNNALGIKSFKGQSLSPTTATITKTMSDAIADWKNLSPLDFHTAEGIDALKQKLGDIRDATQHGTPERLAADRIYNAVRQTIVDQVPEYAKVMKGYEKASKQIQEIERELSLNPKASVSTALGKLQAVLKDNVSSRFGRRRELADFLVNSGAPNLLQKLAGQALKSWEPRGLARAAVMAVESGLAGLGFTAAGPAGAGLALAGLPAMSPRLMGEAAYYGGRAGKGLSKIPAKAAARAAFKAGRQYGGPNE